jgi:phage shock protein PspC (stress-responsive transcriptional regulator)
MKKIININLSGRVIPIEDSAYESLQRYIESLRRFFANEEGRDEIINDIESRIAELMNDKIKKGASAITEEDMDQIISSMGRVEDFDMEEEETTTKGAAAGPAPEPETGRRFSGRLYRNPNDKILGGVCSGIADYLNIDPAIVRLLFALLIFGGGAGFLAYILLWIILPKRPIEEMMIERTPTKRLFRNPDDRVIGGVCGGLAAYFNKDATMFRLIFAAPLLLNILFGILNGIFFAFHRAIFPNFFFGSFTGTFIITYIILWIILPEAKTPYDKMEMRGEKVDVNTIRQNVKEGMTDFKTRMQSWGEEVKDSAQNLGDRAKTFASTRGSEFTTDVKQSGRRVGSRIGHIIGVLFKAFFLFIAGCIAFGLLIGLIALIFGGSVAIGSLRENVLNFFLDGFWQHTFFWGTIILFIFVPAIAFFVWLVRRIMKIRTRRHSLGYIFGGLWVIGIICAAGLASSLVRDFARSERIEQNVAIAQPATGKMIVRVDEPIVAYSGDLFFNDNDDNGWDIVGDTMKVSDVKIRVTKSDDSSYHVALMKFSRGSSRGEAAIRADKIVYNVSSLDSALILGSGYAIDQKTKYRAQRVIVEVQVPVGKKIRFDETVNEKLNPSNLRIKETNWERRSRRDPDFDWDYDRWFDWEPNVDYVMNANGELEDVNKPKEQPVDSTSNKSADSLEKSIQERQQQLEKDQQKLEELKTKQSTTYTPKPKRRATAIAIPFIPAII